jgi:hypothetical protein
MRWATEPAHRRALGAASIAAASALFAAGCALTSRAPLAPSAPPPVPGAVVSEVAALAERARGIESMQSLAVMEYSAGDQHIKAREEITLRRPASMRVVALSPFGVELILAAQGDTLQIFEPSQNRLIRAPATADALNRYVRIPMQPADAVRLLMGLVPAGTPIEKPADSVVPEGAMSVASWRQIHATVDTRDAYPPTAVQANTTQLGFQNGRLVLVRELGAQGRVLYAVRYGEYRDIGGVMFAYVVDADFPQAGSHVTFRFSRPIINGSIPETTFKLTPAPNA